MPSVKEIEEIISITPPDHAMLLVGIHGTGKSESLSDHFTSMGYRIITLFVGQMADAGDMIGLPDRTEVPFEILNSDGSVEKGKTKITEFCPPKWWPRTADEKIIIFLDEVNRGKPEIMQCLMDMVLNRKLNGLMLPPETRVIGAMNPMDDGYYQVEELDPAFFDRWNVYEFKPSIEEWVAWATKNKIHKNVIGFITSHGDHLDPPDSKQAMSHKIYPSRRSWKRVSDILNNNGNITPKLLGTTLLGVIGERSTSAFIKYVKEVGIGIDPGSIITKWGKKIEDALDKMNVQEIVHMNIQLGMWFDENISILNTSDTIGAKYVNNLENYLNHIPAECMADFFSLCATATSEKKGWPTKVLSLSNTIADKFVEILHGNDDELLEWD